MSRHSSHALYHDTREEGLFVVHHVPPPCARLPLSDAMSLTNATPLEVAKAARVGSRQLAVLSTDERNAALSAIHEALSEGKEEVLAANRLDLEEANKHAAGGTLSASLVKRLDLGKPGKYEDMLQGILDVRDLEDPSKSPPFN